MNILTPQRLMRTAAAALALVASLATNAGAQLRPLDPTDFQALTGERARVQVGAAVYFNQFVSLVGTTGQLIEAGNVRASWRSGRIVVELAGTIQRFYREDETVEPPVDGVDASSNAGTRHDAGDYRVQTVLRLTGDTAGTFAILRFGTRLPTTDNRVGLERDQMDFFASVGAARSIRDLFFAAEAGLGINGTRLSNYEQADVLIYSATMELRAPLLSPFILVTGQNDMHDGNVRGNEDLGEVRAGVRLGDARWLTASFVRGYHRSSPHAGLVMSAGISFGR